jgi:dTDP-4-amino-4,6-dideoxygalactose transaminase
LHLQKAYAHLGYSAGDFPVCEAAAEQILSLPMCPHLSAGEQAMIIEEVARLVAAMKKEPQEAAAQAVAHTA